MPLRAVKDVVNDPQIGTRGSLSLCVRRAQRPGHVVAMEAKFAEAGDEKPASPPTVAGAAEWTLGAPAGGRRGRDLEA